MMARSSDSNGPSLRGPPFCLRSYNKGMPPFGSSFSDYFTARSRFRAITTERGWLRETHAIHAAGFADGDLTIDVARIGSANADRLLILSSGLHGTEAPFGSAMQLAWLESLPRTWEPPAGVAVLLIHALNPYGFAKVRRANEDNVDLNRNFLDPGQFAPLKEQTSKEFGPLDPYLNPPKPPGPINWFPLVFPWMALQFGMKTLQHVMPAGQYAFPKGIFYGGETHSQSTRIVMNEMPRWVGPARNVLHLDFHTGLGRFATYKLLGSDGADSEPVRLARSLFGSDLVEADHQTPGGYHNFGDMGEWLSRRFVDRTYLYLCAEFGTYGSTRVIGMLRRENQAHFWGTPESRRYRQIKQACLATFTPVSSKWRNSVTQLSLDLIATAISKWSK